MTRKLTVRKHIHTPPCRNAVPTESHSDGQCAGYFLKTLRTLLLALGYSEPPLFFGVLRLLYENSYLWHVHVIIYERPTANHIHHICHVVEASTPRWMFARERLYEKLWCFCDMKRRNKWSNRSTATSWATPEKELKPWWCPQEIVTTLGASPIKWSWLMHWSEILTRPSRYVIYLALSFYSYTCWVPTISVLNLAISPCCTNLLLKR
jgi:hypothetical protein